MKRTMRRAILTGLEDCIEADSTFPYRDKKSQGIWLHLPMICFYELFELAMMDTERIFTNIASFRKP